MDAVPGEAGQVLSHVVGEPEGPVGGQAPVVGAVEADVATEEGEGGTLAYAGEDSGCLLEKAAFGFWER